MVGMVALMGAILGWDWGGREWIMISVMVEDSCQICLKGSFLVGREVTSQRPSAEDTEGLDDGMRDWAGG